MGLTHPRVLALLICSCATSLMLFTLSAGCASSSANKNLTTAPLFSGASSGQSSGFSGATQAGSSGILAAGGLAGSPAQFDPLSTVKDGFTKVGELLTFSEPVKQAPDPIALGTKARPSPQLYVAMARLSENANEMASAEEYYEKALKLDAKYLDALLGLGRLKDREGKWDEALAYYQKAVKFHPKDATAWNHLGLCLARSNRLRDAQEALEKAIQIAPKESRYRHNMATVCIQMGDLQTALRHLQAVHDEATASYNLGYLLAQKGDYVAAVRYFDRALQLRPGFEDARLWKSSLEEQLGSRSGKLARANDPSSGSTANDPKNRIAARQSGVCALSPQSSTSEFQPDPMLPAQVNLLPPVAVQRPSNEETGRLPSARVQPLPPLPPEIP